MSEPNSGNYKQEVFDEEVLHFCLSVLDFVELFPGDKVLLRRAILDSLGFCSSLEEVGAYLGAVKSSLLSNDRLDHKEILSISKDLGRENKTALYDFLFTVNHLSESKHYESWVDFFNTVKVLQASPSFIFWQDFFKTVRFLTTAHFHSWSVFYSSCKKQNFNSNHGHVFFESVRHACEYFKTGESFQGILRLLSENSKYADAFAYGQLDSKKWLIDEATKVWGKNWGETVFVLAGWVGLLPRMMYDQKIQTRKIRSFDQDVKANEASEIINQFEVQKDWAYKSSSLDITKMSYPTKYFVHRKDGSLCEMEDAPNVVINTSCEHIKNIDLWWDQIPKGTRVILQSNDGFHIPEHVACFKSLHEFSQAMGLSRIDYAGEKELPEFKRFMLIGEK